MNTARGGLAMSLNEALATSIPAIALLAAVAVLSLTAIVRRHGMLWAAPYITGAGILGAVGLCGALFLPGLADKGPGLLHGHAFPIMLTVAIFAAAAGMFSLGALIGLGSRPKDALAAPPPDFTGLQPQNVAQRARIVRVSLWIAWIATLTLVLGVGGPGAVLERGRYLQYTGPRALLSIGNLLELVAAALVGFASVLAQRRQRAWCRVALAVLTVLAFSTGSRRLGLIPALYWFGGFLAGPSKKRLAMLPVIGLLAFTFAGMALTARQQPHSGLAPYLSYFLTHPGSVFQASASQTANALAPFAFVAYAATGLSQSTHDIYVSLNPAPSGWVHYGAISDHFLFYHRHPLPALGTLYRWAGIYAVAAYMFFGGVVMGLAGRVARRMTAARANSIGAVIVSAVAAYFCLKCTQYQLRTNSRVIWYSLAFVIVFGLLSIPGSLLRQSRPKPRQSSVPAPATAKPVAVAKRPPARVSESS
jgi:hypothetical protein